MDGKPFVYLPFILLGIVAGVSPAQGAGSFTYDVIMAGGPSEVFGPGVSVMPGPVSISSSGDMVFSATLLGAGVTADNRTTLWHYTDDAGAVLFAREGRPAAGFDFFTVYDSFERAFIDDAGEVLVRGQLRGPTIDATNAGALWAGDPLALTHVAQQGDPIPGLGPDATYPSFAQNAAYGAGGHMASIYYFPTPQGPSPSGQALVTGAPDHLAPYITTNGQYTPGGVELDSINRVQANRHGELAILGRITGGDYAVLTNAGGTLRPVAMNGQQAQGLTAGVVLRQIELVHVFDNGDTGFSAFLQGPGVTNLNDRSYWGSGPDGAARLLAREGDTMPVHGGTAALSLMQAFTSNGAGVVAVAGLADVPAPNGDRGGGVWYGTPGDMELVIQRRDLVPGAEGFEFGQTFNPVINDRDLLVFTADLIRVGYSTPTVRSVFAYRDGVLVPLLIAGETLDVATPGGDEDLRTVQSALTSPAGVDGGLGPALNDHDQLALTVYFTDGSSSLLRYDLTGVFAPEIDGDLTGDGYVGVEDLDVVLANWGQTTFAGSWRDGDADGDGVVGQGDIDHIIAHWGEGTPPGSVIPEPASAAVWLTLLGLATRRRRAGQPKTNANAKANAEGPRR